MFLSAKNFANISSFLTIQAGKTLLNLRVRKTQSCMERYACLRACKSCFRRSRKQTVTNLITLDGMQHFPREFLDLKAFNSNKAQAICDVESSQEEEIERTGGREAGDRRRSGSQPTTPATTTHAQRAAGAAPDSRLIMNESAENRLINLRQVPQLIRPHSEVHQLGQAQPDLPNQIFSNQSNNVGGLGGPAAQNEFVLPSFPSQPAQVAAGQSAALEEESH